MKRTFSFQMGDNSSGTYSRFSIKLNFLKIAIFLLFFFTSFGIGYFLGKYPESSPSTTLGLETTLTTTTPTPTELPKSLVTSLVTTEPTSESLETKREFIKNLVLQLWSTLLATTDDGSPNDHKVTTIAQALSTLWIADLPEKFHQGKEWLQVNQAQVKKEILVQNGFSTIREFIGSMLACYALSGDGFFLDQAKEAWKVVKKNLGKDDSPQPLGDLGSIHLELRYLYDLTSDTALQTSLTTTRHLLHTLPKPHGLYLSYLSSSNFTSDLSTLDYPSTPFYHTLINSYLQSNGRDLEALEMYKELVNAIDRAHLISQTNGTRLWITRKYNVTSGTFLDGGMNQQVCTLGALFATGLRAITRKSSIESEKELFRSGDVHLNFKHWSWAVGFTEMCRHVAAGTEIGLVPEQWDFDVDGKLAVMMIENGTKWYSSELASSYFHLYRLTHAQKYRDYAWDLAQRIHHLVSNSSQESPESTESTSFLTDLLPQLSSTLKYLYLVFFNEEDTALPLDKWVFNCISQPLPVCGKNTKYTENMCRKH